MISLEPSNTAEDTEYAEKVVLRSIGPIQKNLVPPRPQSPPRFSFFSTHRHHRHPIDQELRTGNNHLVPGLDSVAHLIVIADSFANGQRPLLGHEPSTLGFRYKSKILSRQPRHCQYWNFWILVCAPDHACPNELRLPQCIVPILNASLYQHRLRRVVHLRRNKA